MSNPDSTAVAYTALVAKAKQISERRVQLTAQRDSLIEQQKELERSLVAKYGENYLEKFEEAKKAIEEWEARANVA